MKTIISFVLCCEIQSPKYQLSLRTGCRGNMEHPRHGLVICTADPHVSTAQGRTQSKPSASWLIKDPDCKSYEKQLRKELGKRHQKLKGKKGMKE